MIARCSNPNYTHYSYYGGKGINVCEEWKSSDNFIKWANNNGYDKALTLDRIDGNGNYEPSNCRWITRKEQSHNIKNNQNVTINGVTKPLAQWAEELRINRNTLYKRFYKGLRGQDLIGDIDKKCSCHYLNVITINGINHTIKEWSKITGINENTLQSRKNRGITGEDFLKEVIVGGYRRKIV